MVRMSVKKFSGKPAVLPTQLLLDKVDKGALIFVGGAAMGAASTPSVLMTLPEAYEAALGAKGSVGNDLWSPSLPWIQRRTRPMYCTAGTLTGFLWALSQV